MRYAHFLLDLVMCIMHILSITPARRASANLLETPGEMKMDSYVAKKISHLKRAGLVSASSTGFGLNGGAAPDWLVSEQKERRKALEAAQFRNFLIRERRRLAA